MRQTLEATALPQDAISQRHRWTEVVDHLQRGTEKKKIGVKNEGVSCGVSSSIREIYSRSVAETTCRGHRRPLWTPKNSRTS